MIRKDFLNKGIEEILNQIKKYPEVVAISPFGSTAKGEKKPISDIDIAVILKEKELTIEAEIGSFYLENIDLVLFHRLPLHIQFEVFKFGEEIFVKDEEYLMEIKRKV